MAWSVDVSRIWSSVGKMDGVAEMETMHELNMPSSHQGSFNRCHYWQSNLSAAETDAMHSV